MKSSKSYKKIRIHITTYQKKDEVQSLEGISTMDDDKNNNRKNCKKTHPSKFICSICLNNNNGFNPGNGKKKVTQCPICEKNYDNSMINDKHVPKDKEKGKSHKIDVNITEPNSKTVQTSETHVGQGLNLLNEVLTVFQSKKHIEIAKEKNAKTVIYRDAAVETEFDSKTNCSRPKLTISKIFQYSIEDEQNQKLRNKFIVVNSCQPESSKSHISIKLNKYKSSSIPQMKMEELKMSLKDKTRSKDAIEEVNRMFATVKRNDSYYDTEDETNRPLLRSGPRVLPVVKTTYEADRRYNKEQVSEENVTQRSPRKRRVCKCCQTNNYYLSGGDSTRDLACCHNKDGNREEERCDKCVYMMCCQVNNHQHKNWKTGVMICEYCGNKSKHDNNDEESCNSF